MRLGDILSTPFKKAIPAPSKKPATRALLVFLFGLVGLTVFAWAHNPHYCQSTSSSICIVEQSPVLSTGRSLWATVSPGDWTMRVPIVQSLHHLDPSPYSESVDLIARTLDGVDIQLHGIRVRHQVRVPDASRMLRLLGPSRNQRRAAVRTLTKMAYQASFGRHTLESLIADKATEDVLSSASRLTRELIAQAHIDVLKVKSPTVDYPSEYQTEVARIMVAQRKIAAIKKTAKAKVAEITKRLDTAQANRASKMTELANLYEPRIKAARHQARESNLTSDLSFKERLALAQAQREADQIRLDASRYAIQRGAKALASQVKDLSNATHSYFAYLISRHILPQFGVRSDEKREEEAP